MKTYDFPSNKLYHISQEASISIFIPRPSPSKFNELNRDVVFAITEKLLHNYLFPRDCPRICFYANHETSELDKANFFANTSAEFIITVEENWIERIKLTTLYCYELPIETFELLDECAGYYVSTETVSPISVTIITNPFDALLQLKNVELHILPTLRDLANAVKKSSLAFSLIRMRNAKRK